jgi:hypothetical protein
MSYTLCMPEEDQGIDSPSEAITHQSIHLSTDSTRMMIRPSLFLLVDVDSAHMYRINAIYVRNA